MGKHIKEGKNWDHLDPAKAEEYAKEKKKAEQLANAPISAKIESTGGPYTLKQLTCKKEFRPDDIDPKNLEQSLADDEFQTLFEMDKEAFGALPKWKRQNLKKNINCIKLYSSEIFLLWIYFPRFRIRSRSEKKSN